MAGQQLLWPLTRDHKPDVGGFAEGVAHVWFHLRAWAMCVQLHRWTEVSVRGGWEGSQICYCMVLLVCVHCSV